MECNIIGGKKVNSNLKVSALYKQGDVKVLFILNVHYSGLTRVQCIGRFNKAMNLIEFAHFHNHDTASYNY